MGASSYAAPDEPRARPPCARLSWPRCWSPGARASASCRCSRGCHRRAPVVVAALLAGLAALPPGARGAPSRCARGRRGRGAAGGHRLRRGACRSHRLADALPHGVGRRGRGHRRHRRRIAARGGARSCGSRSRSSGCDTPGARVPRRLSLAWVVGFPDAQRGVEVPALRAGQRWALTVRLQRPHGLVNPGGFDLEAWLLERNLRATGYVRLDEGNRRLDAFAGRRLDRVQRAREAHPRAGARRVAGRAATRPCWSRSRSATSPGWTTRRGACSTAPARATWCRSAGCTSPSSRCCAGGARLCAAAPRARDHLARRGAQARVARRPRRRGRLRAAGGCGSARAAHVLHARGRDRRAVARPARQRLRRVAERARGGAHDRSLGRARSPGSGCRSSRWALLIYAASRERLGARRARTRGGRLARSLAEAAHAQWAITIGLVPLSLLLFGQVSLVGPLANAIAIPAVTFVVVPVTLVAALVPRWSCGRSRTRCSRR